MVAAAAVCRTGWGQGRRRGAAIARVAAHRSIVKCRVVISAHSPRANEAKCSRVRQIWPTSNSHGAISLMITRCGASASCRVSSWLMARSRKSGDSSAYLTEHFGFYRRDRARLDVANQ